MPLALEDGPENVDRHWDLKQRWEFSAAAAPTTVLYQRMSDAWGWTRPVRQDAGNIDGQFSAISAHWQFGSTALNVGPFLP